MGTPFPGSEMSVGQIEPLGEEAEHRLSQPPKRHNLWAENKRWQRVMLLDGEEVIFYTIAALAAALDRSTTTLRGWERSGVIPDAPFRALSDSPKGERRLYTYEAIVEVRDLADSLGMIEHKTLPIPDDFTPGVVAIFERAATAA